jgi:hypothetical protein
LQFYVYGINLWCARQHKYDFVENTDVQARLPAVGVEYAQGSGVHKPGLIGKN